MASRLCQLRRLLSRAHSVADGEQYEQGGNPAASHQRNDYQQYGQYLHKLQPVVKANLNIGARNYAEH